MRGWIREDGRKGIRNVVAVAYLVECAHHVARLIAQPHAEQDVHLIGFPGCYRNKYAVDVMEKICTHPNVGAVLLVSLGCEGFPAAALHEQIESSGRPVETLVIQQSGGTKATIEKGRRWISNVRASLDDTQPVPMSVDELVVGTICGGSDGTSGLTANPAIGRAFDTLVPQGATCIFEETGELIGCEQHMAERAVTPELGEEIVKSVKKAEKYYSVLGHGSFAPGNADGGLTTQEEKSLGAYSKSGASQIRGIIKPGAIPPAGGLYLLDVVPDGEVRFGFPNINDNAEIVELIASGCHLVLFSTGRGSVVGSAIAPVLKICANSDTYSALKSDMDINAGRILSEGASLNEVAREIVQRVEAVASGQQTFSEQLGHQEFLLTYKSFEPAGPACMPQQ